MSWARLLGTAHVCPAPLTSLMAPAAALFCEHIYSQYAHNRPCLRIVILDCSIMVNSLTCLSAQSSVMPVACVTDITIPNPLCESVKVP